MATLINGARIIWKEYQFGVRFPDAKITVWYPDYDAAVQANFIHGGKLKMRVKYLTEEMDATRPA